MSEPLAVKIYDIAILQTELWKDGNSYASIDDLTSNIKSEMNRQITTVWIKNNTEEIYKIWLNSCKNDIINAVNNAFRKIYHNEIDNAVFNIDDKLWNEILMKLSGQNMAGGDGVNFTNIISSIDLDALLVTLGKLIIYLALLAVAGVLGIVLTPIRWIKNFLTDDCDSFDDWNDAMIDKMDNSQMFNGKTSTSKKLDSDKRKKIYKNLVDGRNEQLSKFKDCIKNQLKSELDKQNQNNGLGIDKALQDSLDNAIATVALQNIRSI
jgi:hypothetical protein